MDARDFVFLAIDADNAGKKVGRAVIADDVAELHAISKRINHGQDLVQQWADSLGGEKISGGGDEMTLVIPRQALDEIEQFRKDYEFAIGLTISVGVGESLSQAGKSLLVAKSRGKNQVAIYGQDVEQELAQSKDNVAAGTANSEEQKLYDAYLKPEETQGEPMDKQLRHEDVCPYCKRMESQKAQEPAGDDCPYCDTANTEVSVEDPTEPQPTGEPSEGDVTATSAEDFSNDVGTQQLPKPSPVSETSIPVAPAQDEPSSNNIQLEADQAKESADEIVDSMPEGAQPELEPLTNDDEHSDDATQNIANQFADPTETSEDAADDIDDSQLPINSEMEGNTSRPDGFNDDVPEDLGLDQKNDPTQDEINDEPDFAGILKEDLNSHVENINREKVINLIGNALQGFKDSKHILEKAKEQAPALYNSSIAMLKAMIEMAKMLDLNPSAADADEDMNQPSEEDNIPQMSEPQEEEEQATPQAAPEKKAPPQAPPKKEGQPSPKPKGQQ